MATIVFPVSTTEEEALNMAMELSLCNPGSVWAYYSEQFDQCFLCTDMISPNCYDNYLGKFRRGERIYRGWGY